MMHGYIALDKDGNMLAPFQTWRNSNTQKAADELTELFNFNIPLRWTIAHLYQCVLDDEPHLKEVDFVTTLDSYIHCRLTGEKVTGIGDASGIFPIDSETKDYDQKMVDKFDRLIKKEGYTWRLRDVLPKVLVAGTGGGHADAEGARSSTRRASLRPVSRSARRKATPEQAWWRRIRSRRERAMCPPGRAHLRCSCSRSRLTSCTARSIW